MLRKINQIICRKADCKSKSLSEIYQLAVGDVTVNSLKKVDGEVFLGREPVKMNLREITDILSSKVIQVTGCGGGIGQTKAAQYI